MKFLITSLAIFAWFLQSVTAADSFVEGEVLVTFRPNMTEAQQDAALAKNGLRMGKRFKMLSARGGGAVSWIREKSRTTAQLIAMLKARQEIATVEPNYIRRFSRIIPNDTHFPQLWGLENKAQFVNTSIGIAGVDTQFAAAWRLANPVANEIVIGIIDSGLDIDHPDIKANLWINSGEIPGDGIDNDSNGRIDDIHGFDFASNAAQISDSGDHGTHVAGTAAAVGRNASGVIGVDFRTKLIAMKASIDGDTILTSSALAAYNYAITMKARGVNIVALNASFGGNTFSTTERNAIIALRDSGIILCAAAGNESTNNDLTPSYPANYDVSNIISVAAITSTNGLASFSNFGATSVDLAAPGQNIYSTARLTSFPFISTVTVGATSYAAQSILGAGAVIPPGISGNVIRCGIGNPGEFPPEVSGNIALIQRGTITFASKVANAMKAGAVAAIIDDNTADDLSVSAWQLSNAENYIPAVRVTRASGLAIDDQLPSAGIVVNGPSASAPYRFLSGTSMATPHVTGAVAFAARNFPTETISQRISRILNNVTPVAALTGKMTSAGRLDLLGIVDTDRDQLPDWWETAHFGNLAQTATDNPDSDNFSNLEEFLTGTSPVSAASQLAFSSAAAAAGNDFQLAFPSELDSAYEVEYSDDLATWFSLETSIQGTGGVIEMTDPNALSESVGRFYRISLLPH